MAHFVSHKNTSVNIELCYYFFPRRSRKKHTEDFEYHIQFVCTNNIIGRWDFDDVTDRDNVLYRLEEASKYLHSSWNNNPYINMHKCVTFGKKQNDNVDRYAIRFYFANGVFADWVYEDEDNRNEEYESILQQLSN